MVRARARVLKLLSTQALLVCHSPSGNAPDQGSASFVDQYVGARVCKSLHVSLVAHASLSLSVSVSARVSISLSLSLSLSLSQSVSVSVSVYVFVALVCFCMSAFRLSSMTHPVTPEIHAEGARGVRSDWLVRGLDGTVGSEAKVTLRARAHTLLLSSSPQLLLFLLLPLHSSLHVVVGEGGG